LQNRLHLFCRPKFPPRHTDQGVPSTCLTISGQERSARACFGARVGDMNFGFGELRTASLCRRLIIDTMAPNLALSQHNLIYDMILDKNMKVCTMADAAECSERSILAIRSNIRYFGRIKAPFSWYYDSYATYILIRQDRLGPSVRYN